ncbi:hypothetical protein [Streptomyces sp. NBC_00035]|uniref:hypothetical protein n=1 Tax=Streptomyces sp. NBC_00035 TaxID=2903614 RepID=UPI00386CAF6F
MADAQWARVFTPLMAQADTNEDINWAVSLDSTIVRAHQTRPGPRPTNRQTSPSAGPAAD